MKSAALLVDFNLYCEAHPSLRFWQALRGWSQLPYIYAGTNPRYGYDDSSLYDTFYWDEKNHLPSVFDEVEQ